MGMASYHNGEHIDIVNKEGLLKFLENAEKHDQYKHYADALSVNDEENTVSFEGFDGWKIISYWYPSFCEFLNGLAVFVEGHAEFTFEDPNEMARIHFRDGEVFVNIGRMKFEEVQVQELSPEMDGLSDWLKREKLLRKI